MTCLGVISFLFILLRIILALYILGLSFLKFGKILANISLIGFSVICIFFFLFSYLNIQHLGFYCSTDQWNYFHGVYSVFWLYEYHYCDAFSCSYHFFFSTLCCYAHSINILFLSLVFLLNDSVYGTYL